MPKLQDRPEAVVPAPSRLSVSRLRGGFLLGSGESMFGGRAGLPSLLLLINSLSL